MKTKSRLRNKGKYIRSYWFHFAPLIYLIVSIIALYILQLLYTNKELIDPCNGCSFNFKVRAYEPEIEIVNEPKSIEQMILDTFGEDGELMVKVFTCESGLNPETIGDKHLMGWLDGEYLGDSIGIAQIRTGDAGVYDSKSWNRAKANGMSVVEFREKLKDPEYNIKYAKSIYERQGKVAWFNCYQKVK